MPSPSSIPCQRCGLRPATVHLTDVVNKARRVQHICEACARAHQLIPTPDDPAQPLNLPALVQLVFGAVPPGATEVTDEPLDPDAGLTCPDCGRTYAEFRAEGRAGCPTDYDTFRKPLLPLLERIHRQTEYAGKVPRCGPRRDGTATLHAELRDAVAAEDYERAAALRDAIRRPGSRKPRMNLDHLIPKLGEWLQGKGPDADVVVSTRVRLARNLAGTPFTTKATPEQKSATEVAARAALADSAVTPKLAYVDVNELPALDRQFLVERQLISRELASVLDGPRGVAFDDRESVSVMVNEEDHLRMQVLRSGLDLDDAWAVIDRLDDALEARLPFAFHKQFGYLTACPTNVGTGMRASVMVHLPALGITKQIEKVFKALQKINLVVRGLYGEGSRASGDLYQISNQVTLGRAEPRVLLEIREVIGMILNYEREARQVLLRERKQPEQDRAARAVGTLVSATMITSEETMELLSAVRLGIHLRLIDDIPATTVNELFIRTQSAHLQKLTGRSLGAEERNTARAKYLREKFREFDVR